MGSTFYNRETGERAMIIAPRRHPPNGHHAAAKPAVATAERRRTSRSAVMTIWPVDRLTQEPA
jgi:hypothetical protein